MRFLRSSQRHGTGGHHPISIHALREEGDPGRDRRRRWSGHFYPRPPRGGRHAGEALRVGSVIISIHALREEGDLIRLLCMANSAIFLSTPSARRATAQLAALTAELEDFYPRPPRGGRPSTPPPWSSVAHFYPRPPRGGRPALPGDLLVLFFISIHALREEGDYFANSAKYQITLFLSTPSARRATLFLQHKRPPCRFLSTPSARRATGGAAAACKKRRISIHALREEGDRRKLSVRWPCTAISIHALREEGDVRTLHLQAVPEISIHALREEGDHRAAAGRLGQVISIHALREEGDLLVGIPPTVRVISIHALREEGDGCSISCMVGSGISIHALREEGDSSVK